MNEVSQENRTMAMLAHLLGILTGVIGALVIWLINKDKPDASFVTDQAKEALNFQITIFIAYMAGVVLSIILIGFFVCMAAWVASVVLSIMGGMKANEGVAYRYPFALRLIK